MKHVMRLVSIFIIVYALGFLILSTSWHLLSIHTLFIYILGIELFCFLVYFTYISFLRIVNSLQKLSVVLNGLFYFTFMIVSAIYLKNNEAYIGLLQRSNISLYYKSIFTSNTPIYISFIFALVSSVLMYLFGKVATKLETFISNNY